MDGNIKVDVASIGASLESFQAAMLKLETLFDEVQTQTSQMSSFWAGKAGDETRIELEKFYITFQRIDTQNQRYVEFLNKTAETYSTSEANISATIDSAANAGLGINGSGL